MKYFVLFSTLLLINCNSNKDLYNNSNVELPIIEIDLDEQHEFNDIVEFTDYIVLQATDESLFGNISRLIMHDDKIYILDSYTKSLLVFKANGDFIFKINRFGKGPGEYIRPVDFDLNNNNIYLYCADLIKIIKYDLDGQYVNESKIEIRPLSFASTSNGFACDNIMESSSHNLFLLNENGDVNEKYFEHVNYQERLTPHMVDRLQRSVDGIYYSPLFYNRFYKITEDQNVKPVFEVKFNPLKFTKESIGLPDNPDNLKTYLESIPHKFHNISFNNDYLVFNFYYNKIRCLCVYSPKSSKVKLYNKPNNLDIYPLNKNLYLTESNMLVTVDEIGFINMSLDDIKKNDSMRYDEIYNNIPKDIKNYIIADREKKNPLIILSKINEF